MHFLNPLILAGLLAASIPLLIHFLSRRRPKEIAYPSIQFLKLMQTDRIRLLKVKHLIVLLLRMLVIAMLVIAFARPALKSFFKRNSQASAVIILDGSASMRYVDNGEIVFSQALRKAGEIVSMLPAGDAAAVIVSKKKPVLLGSGLTQEKNLLLNALSNLECSWSESSPAEAFGMALELLRSSGCLNKELYFLTDGADNSLPDSVAWNDPSLRLYTVLFGSARRGGAVVESVSLRERLWSPGRPMTFHAVCCVPGSETEVDIEFFVNKERKGKTRVQKTTDNRADADFTYIPETVGWHSLTAAVTGGYFEPGEKRRIAVFVPPRVNVLACGGTEDDLYFVDNALVPDPEHPLFTVKRVLEHELTGTDIATADVVILAGITVLDSSVYRSLVNAVMEQGIGIMIFPPQNIQQPLYAEGVLRDIFPATIVKRISYNDQPGEGYSAVTWFDLSHPVFASMTETGDFSRPRVKSYPLMKPSPDVRVLARFRDGAMAVGESSCGKGKAIMIAVGASSQDSDFPLTGVFVPFFTKAMQYLSGKTSATEQYLTGDNISENLGDVQGNVSVRVKHEDRPPLLVESEQTEKGLVAKGIAVDKPGYYSVFAADEEHLRFAVNVPESEVLFKRAVRDDYARVFPGVRFSLLDGTKNIAEHVMNDRYGKELYGLFFLLALAFLAAEMALARKV